MSTTRDHHWSGWPGAWCLHCGAADRNEEELAGIPENERSPAACSWTGPPGFNPYGATCPQCVGLDDERLR